MTSRLDELDFREPGATAMNGFVAPRGSGAWSDDDGSPEHLQAKRFKVRCPLMVQVSSFVASQMDEPVGHKHSSLPRHLRGAHASPPPGGQSGFTRAFLCSWTTERRTLTIGSGLVSTWRRLT